MTTDKKELRRKNCSARLARLVNLRKSGAPMWVIKSEQVALVLNHKGRKHAGIGSDGSKLQKELYLKHVRPHMEDETAEF